MDVRANQLILLILEETHGRIWKWLTFVSKWLKHLPQCGQCSLRWWLRSCAAHVSSARKLWSTQNPHLTNPWVLMTVTGVKRTFKGRFSGAILEDAVGWTSNLVFFEPANLTFLPGRPLPWPEPRFLPRFGTATFPADVSFPAWSTWHTKNESYHDDVRQALHIAYKRISKWEKKIHLIQYWGRMR